MKGESWKLRRANAYPGNGESHRYWDAGRAMAVPAGGTRYASRAKAEAARQRLPKHGSGWSVVRLLARGID